MSFIYSMADTWNAIGTTFNSIMMDISNGAGGAPVGAAASRALNLKANGTSIFQIDISGAINKNTAALPAGISTDTILQLGNADGVNSRIILDAFASGPLFSYRRANTSAAAPSALTTNDQILNISAFGYQSGGAYSTGGRILLQGFAAEAWTATNQGTYLTISTTPIGAAAAVQRLKFDPNGSFLIGNAALATNATDGFVYIPTCAGTPTGTPTAVTGLVPMVFDTTNSQFWFYTGGAWKQPKTPAGAALVTWQ